MAGELLAITGATGFVGQAVLEYAARAGIEVRALARRPQEARAGVEWVQGDIPNYPNQDDSQPTDWHQTRD